MGLMQFDSYILSTTDLSCPRQRNEVSTTTR